MLAPYINLVKVDKIWLTKLKVKVNQNNLHNKMIILFIYSMCNYQGQTSVNFKQGKTFALAVGQRLLYISTHLNHCLSFL